VKRSGFVLFAIVLFVLDIGAFAASKKDEVSRIIDSGSFGVFVNGQRVATENFQIHQKEGYSVATSELKMDDGSDAAQQAQLEILSNGDLRKYEWHELNPSKARAVVHPSDQFLIEQITPRPGDKPTELAFFAPASTMVLDDYFFSQREILLWRYIASTCGQPSPGKKTCQMPKTRFGIFIPRQQTPSVITVEYKGPEKISIRGAERDLERFDLSMEGLNWSLWVDWADSYKLQRILIAGEKTEIIRD